MVGIDIVSISRIDTFIKRYKQKGLKKFLSDEEIAISSHSSHSIAGFWALKESVSKAIGCGIGSDLSFHDIHITKTSKNAPCISLSTLAQSRFGIKKVYGSITHDGGFAAAISYIVFD